MEQPAYTVGDEYFLGNKFIWWQGVIEDVNDPLKLGRCRVRIAGYHNPDTQKIPVDHLPWASCIYPVNSACISEVGISPTGLLPGSWVVGFFRDPDYFQQPVIFGSIPGIPQKQGVDIGNAFKDPSGKYPLKTHLNESDLSRLARNEKIDQTIVKKKRDTRVKNVRSALGRETWNEPEVPYDAKYPKNHVVQTESGHIQEFDDTPSKERIHTYHRTGTFDEVHPDGTETKKIVSEKYEIVYDDSRILIKGLKSENVDKNSNMRVGGDLNIEVRGTAYVLIKGDCIMQVDGNHFEKCKGTYTVVSEGNMTLIAPRIDLNPGGPSVGDVLK